MNKNILISSVLALSISLIPITNVKSMSFGPTPPPGTNQNYILPCRIDFDIISEDSTKIGRPIKFESDARNQLENGYYMISYSWDFGDGNTSSDSVASNIFTKPGVYTVKLRIDATERPGYHQSGYIKRYFGETTKTIKVD